MCLRRTCSDDQDGRKIETCFKKANFDSLPFRFCGGAFFSLSEGLREGMRADIIPRYEFVFRKDFFVRGVRVCVAVFDVGGRGGERNDFGRCGCRA